MPSWSHDDRVLYAYRHAFFRDLVELCREQYLPTDLNAEPRRTVRSEHLPLRRAEIPASVIEEVLVRFLLIAKDSELELGRLESSEAPSLLPEGDKYEPFITLETKVEKPAGQAPAKEPASPRRRKKRRGGDPGGASGASGAQGGSGAPGERA